MAYTSTDMDPEDILGIIRKNMGMQTRNQNLSLELEPFAALLVRLSKDSSETSKRNIRLQNGAIFLTVLVLAVACAQLWVASMQLSQSHVSQPQQTTTKDKPKTDTSERKPIQANELNAPSIPQYSIMQEPQPSIPHLDEHSNAP